MPSTAVVTARRDLARSLDDLGIAQVTSATTTAFTAALLIDGIASPDTTRFNGRWAYTSYGALPAPTGGGQQRRVRNGSYVGSTGTVTIDPAWTAPTAGVEVELTGLFPANPQIGEDGSYLGHLRAASDRILVEDHIDVTTTETSGRPTQAYLLSDQPWLDRPERILAVKDPPRAVGYPFRPTWRRWSAKFEQGAVFIEFEDRAYPAGSLFQVQVLRPASSLINGAESPIGVLLDTDTLNVVNRDWVDTALVYAYQALFNRNRGRPDGGYYQKWKDQLAWVERNVKGYDGGAPQPPAAAEAA